MKFTLNSKKKGILFRTCDMKRGLCSITVERMCEKDEAHSLYFCSPEVRGKLRGQKGPRCFFAPIIKRSFLSYVESV